MEDSDTACLRDTTAASTLIRVSLEEHEPSGSFSALMLCIEKKKKNHEVEGENMNTPESTKTFSYGNSIIFFKKTATYIIKSNMSSGGV